MERPAWRAVLRLRLRDDALEHVLPIAPRAVGEDAAERVAALARTEVLAYFPPLDYALRAGAVDAELAATLGSIAELAVELARRALATGLRPRFHRVDVEDVQAEAFTLPTVRPRAPNARAALAAHFTPDALRVTLLLHPREAGDPETLAAWLREALEPRFARVAVVDCRAVPE